MMTITCVCLIVEHLLSVCSTVTTISIASSLFASEHLNENKSNWQEWSQDILDCLSMSKGLDSHLDRTSTCPDVSYEPCTYCNFSPGSISIVVGWESLWPNWATIWSISAVWKRQTVFWRWSHFMAIPAQKDMSPRLDIVQIFCMSSLNRLFSSFNNAMERKLLMCTAVIMISDSWDQ